MYLVINFKAYGEGYGKSLDRLVQVINDIKPPQGIDIIIAPPNPELSRIKSKFPKLKVYAQTVDLNELGSYTGTMPISAVALCGIDGFIINHPEKRRTIPEIESAITLSRKMGINYLVCVSNLEELKKVLKFKPSITSIEPPELIGTGVSAAAANPDLIVNAVQLTKKISPDTELLLGAGISGPLDIKKAIKLGTKGVMLASAFVKSKEPEKKLGELLSGFKS